MSIHVQPSSKDMCLSADLIPVLCVQPSSKDMCLSADLIPVLCLLPVLTLYMYTLCTVYAILTVVSLTIG